MDHAVIQHIRACWLRLQEQHAWAFVRNEQAFLAAVVTEVERVHGTALPPDKAIKAIITFQYNQILFAGLLAKSSAPNDLEAEATTERAAEEILNQARRLACSRIRSQEKAEEIAQRAVTRLLEKPTAVRVPGALTAWLVWQIRDLVTQFREQDQKMDEPLTDDITTPEITYNAADVVENQLFEAEVTKLLTELLSAMQSTIIKYVIFDGLLPREIAKILRVPDYKVRVEKSRAIKILRADQRLRNLLEDVDYE